MNQRQLDCVLVEDNATLRIALAETLTDWPLLGTLTTFSGFRQVIESPPVSADLVLLDISLPDGNGLDLIPYFRKYSATVRIVVLTVHQERAHTLRAIRSGVDGYLLTDEENLLRQLEDVVAGRNPIDGRVAGHLISDIRETPAHADIELTPREQQVLSGLAQGMSYAQLAEHMKVSEQTVPGYIKSLYRKLDVTSKNQAVYRGTTLGLLNVS